MINSVAALIEIDFWCGESIMNTKKHLKNIFKHLTYCSANYMVAMFTDCFMKDLWNQDQPCRNYACTLLHLWQILS